METNQSTFSDNNDFNRLKDSLVNQIVHELDINSIAEEDRNQAMVDLIIQKFHEQKISLSDEIRDPLFHQIINEILGFGILQPFLDDPDVSEVLVNGKDNIFITKNNKLIHLHKQFRSNEELVQLIFRCVKRLGCVLDPDNPTLVYRMSDGAQLNIVLPPVAVENPILSIHKSTACTLSMRDLLDKGTLSITIADFLQACVAARLNILVIGLGGTGKTTLINGLAGFIPDTERLIAVEETPQFTFKQKQLIRLESRFPRVESKSYSTSTDLIHMAINMNPDRLIVDELQGSEGLAFLQALNTGCSGSLAAVHANSPFDAISRLETMCLMTGITFPIRVIHEQIAAALDLMIHISRYKDGIRRIATLTEISGMESENIILTDIFRFEQTGADPNGRVLGHLKPTGIRPLFSSRLESNGYKLNPETFGTNLVDYLRRE
jgi:pilus assembly protein CpaF